MTHDEQLLAFRVSAETKASQAWEVSHSPCQWEAELWHGILTCLPTCGGHDTRCWVSKPVLQVLAPQQMWAEECTAGPSCKFTNEKLKPLKLNIGL